MPYIRILGAVILFCSSAYIGSSAALRIRREVRTLQQLRQSMEILRCEVSYTHTTFGKLCEILITSTTGEVRSFYAALKQRLEEGQSSAAAQLTQKYFPFLSPAAAQTVRELFSSFGRFDAQSQLRLIDEAEQCLVQELTAVTEEKHQRAKCYRTLGICTGLAIAILVL